MNNQSIEYFIYARKSSESEDRQVLSIDSQKNELQELVKRSSIKVMGIKEEAHSAKSPGRPIFNELLDSVEQGKVAGVVVWNVDRLSRNSVDTGRLIYLFDIGKLQEIITPSQVFRNTPNDKFLLSLLCSQAKLENDNKGLNVKRGLKAKVDRGIYPAQAPTGYINNKYADKGSKTIEIDPERFDTVKMMLEMVLSQKYSALKVLNIATNDWKYKTKEGTPISRSNWYYILTNPFYAGIFEYPQKSGSWYKGVHKSMITEEQFDLIQAILGQKGKQRPKTHVFAFTGLMRCGECKAMITCEEKVKRQKNGNVHRYIYYHCTKRVNPNCTQGSIEEKKLSKQILKTVSEIKIPNEFHDWALKWLRKENVKVAEDRNVVLGLQQHAYKSCLSQIDELIDMRSAKEITPEQFAEKKSKLEKEKIRLEELLTDTGDKAQRWLNKADELFDFARDAQDKFNNGGLDGKRHVLSKLGSNLILKDQILITNLEETLLPMKEAAEEVKKIHARLEPLEMTERVAILEAEYSQNPILLPQWDSTRTEKFLREVWFPSNYQFQFV